MTIRDLRTAIANSVEPNHKLSLTEWLNRAARIHPDIDELLDSMPDVFFAKESGSYQTGQLPSFAHTAAGRPTYHALVFGWCYGAIEYAYLS